MKKVIFLDRDGTINVDHGFVHKIEDWQFTDQAIEALQSLRQQGFVLTIITDQTGIGEGMYSEEDLRELHNYMQQELKKHDIIIDAIAYCPHRRDEGCNCRKPNTDMAKQIEAKIGPIDYANSWTIGDKEKDVGFGKKVGTKAALIPSRYWNKHELELQPDLFVASLYEFAQKIAGHR